MTSIQRKAACLDTAKAAVCGDRALNYGSPEDNFGRIATLWNAWLKIRREPASTLGTVDVAIMMGLVKDARLANNPDHMDSWVDKAGYAACGADLVEATHTICENDPYDIYRAHTLREQAR